MEGVFCDFGEDIAKVPEKIIGFVHNAGEMQERDRNLVFDQGLHQFIKLAGEYGFLFLGNRGVPKAPGGRRRSDKSQGAPVLIRRDDFRQRRRGRAWGRWRDLSPPLLAGGRQAKCHRAKDF